MTAGADDGKQNGETVGSGPSVASAIAESSENGGQQKESMNGASMTEEEAVGPARACGDDGAVVVGDVRGASGGENAASSSSLSTSQEGTPSDTCAPSSAVAHESAKLATALKEGQVAEDFFRETASQLTYYGLSRLHQEVRCVAHSATSALAVLCKNHANCNGLGAPLGWPLRFTPPCRSASVNCAFSFATTTSAPCLSTRASFFCS